MVKWLALAIRIAIGAAFVYAGIIKLQDPSEFAINIASFQILPNFLISPMALALPPFEIICGALLIAGVWRRAAALGIVVLLTVFLIAIAAALARGLTIDCGCFGTGTPSRAKMWLDLGRDALLLGGALIAYGYSGHPPARTSRTLASAA